MRPEKIQIDAKKPGSRITTGTIREVEYLGPSTRFLLELDAGISLTALAQNATEGSTSVEAMRNSKVSVSWDIANEYQVEG